MAATGGRCHRHLQDAIIQLSRFRNKRQVRVVVAAGQLNIPHRRLPLQDLCELMGGIDGNDCIGGPMGEGNLHGQAMPLCQGAVMREQVLRSIRCCAIGPCDRMGDVHQGGVLMHFFLCPAPVTGQIRRRAQSRHAGDFSRVKDNINQGRGAAHGPAAEIGAAGRSLQGTRWVFDSMA